uniref:NADH-ubiquinone oxidoreductase chain 2 n=1 Tax=Curculionoidea sp. 10 KM-2017 TaxID=2219393 RepID=A0A346RI94_9CUCU|nr:NADH dehydrogenase subunit 2 [Curculionoidea sp. 10 KM-2017]
MKLWKILFFNFLIMGTLISISSISWFSMWMGLEINLLSFIPLISKYKNLYSSESAIKYFMIQAIASIILLMSMIIFSMNFSLNNSSLMMNSALFLKMGAAPFHFWMPEIIEGLSWFLTFTMLTWQKIAPMILLMYNISSISFFMIFIFSSMIISTLFNLNQSSLRKILVFSSINHIGWMLSIIYINQTIWLIYFLIYFFLSMKLIFMFFSLNIFNFNQISLFSNSKLFKLFFLVNFFSLGGLPPFLGFFSKWIILNELLMLNVTFTIFMIFITLIMLFSYIRIFLPSLILKSQEISNKMNFSKKLTFLNYLNFMFLMLNPLIYFIF